MPVVEATVTVTAPVVPIAVLSVVATFTPWNSVTEEQVARFETGVLKATGVGHVVVPVMVIWKDVPIHATVEVPRSPVAEGVLVVKPAGAHD